MSETSPLFAEFPEISHLSREDLEDLLNDPMYFQAIFHSLPRVRELFESQAELGMANESIAKNTMALQEDLNKVRSETKDAFEEAKGLQMRWREVEREQRDVYQRFTPQFLLMRLRHSTTDQDDESEASASSFIQDTSASPADSKSIDDFVRDFRALRKVYHKRVIWGDRWAAGQVTWSED